MSFNHSLPHRFRKLVRKDPSPRLALLAVILSAGIAGCSSVSTLVMRPESPSPARRTLLGSRAYHHHLSLYPPAEDTAGTTIVAEVGERLAAASGRKELPWEFVLVLDPEVRVSAYPGGKVVVSDGMLAACRSEAQLAAAMAHEMGHMLAGHPISHTAPINGAGEPAASGEGSDGTGTQANASAGRPTVYSRHEEEEADSLALSMLVQAGYDPEVVRSAWLGGGNRSSANQARHPLDHNRRISLMESLTQAKQVYASHSAPLGSGQSITYRSRVPREPAPQIAGAPHRADMSVDIWTPAERRGGAKPDGWNTDLAESKWLPPDEGNQRPKHNQIIQVQHEWASPATDRSDDDRKMPDEQADSTVSETGSAGPILLPRMRDDLREAGLRPIE